VRNQGGRPIRFEIRFERKKNDSQLPKPCIHIRVGIVGVGLAGVGTAGVGITGVGIAGAPRGCLGDSYRW